MLCTHLCGSHFWNKPCFTCCLTIFVSWRGLVGKSFSSFMWFVSAYIVSFEFFTFICSVDSNIVRWRAAESRSVALQCSHLVCSYTNRRCILSYGMSQCVALWLRLEFGNHQCPVIVDSVFSKKQFWVSPIIGFVFFVLFLCVAGNKRRQDYWACILNVILIQWDDIRRFKYSFKETDGFRRKFH